METAAETIPAINVETKIEASAATVWRALTENVADWWPEASFAAGGEGDKTFRLEPRPGGLMYEDWADGSGLLWGHVTTVVPEKMLQVVGHTFPEWGGPAIWFGTWKLEEEDGTSVLRFTHNQLGATHEGWDTNVEKGWIFIWSVLKAHVEGKPAPVWEE